MIRVKKNPPQDKKLANASNRRATEIYGLDYGGLELVLIIPQVHLNALEQCSHGLSPSGVRVLFL